MKLRTAAAALASSACAALTVATLVGPAGAATAGPQAINRPDGAATDTNISMTIDGSKTATTVDFDHQPTVRFDFNVSNDGSVGITGDFSLLAFDPGGNNEQVVCGDVPMHGFSEGDCTIPDGKLAPGVWKILANYNGDDNNDASASGAETLTVNKEPTSTSLTPVSSVHYGQESDETFTVTANPRTSGTPTGTFNVTDQDGFAKIKLCDTLSLTNGSGTCALADTRFGPGTVQVFGDYSGDSTYTGSTSDIHTFTILPGGTQTSMSLSEPSIGFSQQQTEKITVHVTPVGKGTPTGQVIVHAGGTIVCTAPVGNGTATCSPAAGKLPVGSYQLTASYSGDLNFANSDSGQAPLTITDKSTATPSLTLSAANVTFGNEQAEKFTANVTGQVSGITPGGTIAVKAGTATVCTITLASGQGMCAPGATKLRAGSYRLTAAYSGDDTYGAAASASIPLTVKAEPTTTSLKLSAARVKVGHEQTEHLTVTVKPTFSGTPAGKVTVRAGSISLCVITLKKATGTCALTASKLRPGTYHLTATYAGATSFVRSTSPKKTLTVTK